MITHPDLAILFSGGTDSLALYGLACNGHLPSLGRPQRIHLLNMLNGMGRFPTFTKTRYEVSRDILQAQLPDPTTMPESLLVELDMGRLFQGLWLDRYEELMPRYNNKNLVCVACKVAMHIRAILYCTEHLISSLVAGYTKKQDHYPEQTPVFMEKISAFSDQFGIRTSFPVYDDFDEQMNTRHVLEDLGLPSTGGGERKCLFAQTLTTATEEEIGAYLDDMLPRASAYLDHRLSGRLKEAAAVFPPGV